MSKIGWFAFVPLVLVTSLDWYAMGNVGRRQYESDNKSLSLYSEKAECDVYG